MGFSVRYEPLLDYSDHERRKWRDWIAADPARLDITVQPGARFPAIGALLDHIYFVERRHLSRLEGGTPPDATGIPAGDWERLFEYADLVRADLRRYAEDVDDAIADTTISFTGWDGVKYTMSRRKLLTHIVLHEVRHLAQIALAARLHGVEPPGAHDIAFCPEFA
jgi:uncharacterized damage-inducible protein DinB